MCYDSRPTVASIPNSRTLTSCMISPRALPTELAAAVVVLDGQHGTPSSELISKGMTIRWAGLECAMSLLRVHCPDWQVYPPLQWWHMMYLCCMSCKLNKIARQVQLIKGRIYVSAPLLFRLDGGGPLARIPTWHEWRRRMSLKAYCTTYLPIRIDVRHLVCRR